MEKLNVPSFQAGRNVRDLFEDLRDGHNLLSLLEVLSGEILVRIKVFQSKLIRSIPISKIVCSAKLEIRARS